MNIVDKTSQVDDMNTKKRNSLKDYFALMPVLTYFFQKRKPINFNVRMMHWTNKISIIMFLIALVIWIVRHI